MKHATDRPRLNPMYSEDFYRELMENSFGLICCHDLEGRLLLVNRAAADSLGYSPEEMTGRMMDEFIPEGTRHRLPGYLSKIEKKGHHEGLFNVCTRQGEDRILQFRTKLLRDHNYALGHAIDVTARSSAVRDVTEQKQSHDHQARLTATLEATTDLVSIADESGQLTYLNRAGRELMGLSAGGDIRGLRLEDMRPAAAAMMLLERAIPAARDSGAWSGETVLRTYDGREFPVSEVVLAHHSDSGELFYSTVARDIRERHELERLKNEFISTVSHELRTPLTSIRGALGLMISGSIGAMPQPGQRMLEIAVDNTDRLVRLINDILDIERMESGRATLTPRPCELGAIMKDSLEVMRPMAEKAGVELVLSSARVAVFADPDRLVQAFTNLLSNAIKFTPSGGRVFFSVEDRSQELCFCVRDEGRGIPAEKLETIFDRFQQVNATDAREKGGTGLGLAICRTIAEQHGGRIWVESRVGSGSSFYLTLPRDKAVPLAAGNVPEKGIARAAKANPVN